MTTLAYIHWDPSPILFTLPYLNLSIRWYGVLFALGFVLAYFVIAHLFRKVGYSRELSRSLTDRLTWFAIIGTIVGARLGHVLFYDFPFYKEHPLAILKTWEGGLASHGGVIGIFIALSLFYRHLQTLTPRLSFLQFLDLFAVAIPLTCFFIRLGNFFNQEIIGTPTSLPWGVIFSHPHEGWAGIPYHAVQLYEGFAYLATFGILYTAWIRFRTHLKPGTITGMMFLFIFGSRFLLEYIKMPQGGLYENFALQTGQILSIPCIISGLALILYPRKYIYIDNN